MSDRVANKRQARSGRAVVVAAVTLLALAVAGVVVLATSGSGGAQRASARTASSATPTRRARAAAPTARALAAAPSLRRLQPVALRHTGVSRPPARREHRDLARRPRAHRHTPLRGNSTRIASASPAPGHSSPPPARVQHVAAPPFVRPPVPAPQPSAPQPHVPPVPAAPQHHAAPPVVPAPVQFDSSG